MLFQEHRGFDPDPPLKAIDDAISQYPDPALLKMPEDEVVASVLTRLAIPAVAIVEDSSRNVRRGSSPSDSGYVVYEHAIDDPSGFLKCIMSGVRFPVPRHEVRNNFLVLKYPALGDPADVEKKHVTDFQVFRVNVDAVNVNIRQRNAVIERAVRARVRAAKEAAENRKRFQG